MTDLAEVVTQCDDEAVLVRIAEALVDRRLAACVHVGGPVTSTYRWQGALERTPEWVLTAVTTRERASAAMALIVDLHPYELPSILAREVSATEDYTRWVREETSPGAPDES